MIFPGMTGELIFIIFKKPFMTLLGILLTVLAAVVTSTIFYFVIKTTGPWESFWTFMLVLVLAGLAAGLWIVPAGPIIWGVAWIPILMVMIIVALLLGAASPRKQKRVSTKREGNKPVVSDTEAATVGALFWILLIFLLGVIIWKLRGGYPLT